jgi:hypothetical protein
MKTKKSDPKEYTVRIKADLKKISQQLKVDVDRVDEPQAKALFEVSAEVIEGLIKAFSDYEEKNEKAWIDDQL